MTNLMIISVAFAAGMLGIFGMNLLLADIRKRSESSAAEAVKEQSDDGQLSKAGNGLQPFTSKQTASVEPGSELETRRATGQQRLTLWIEQSALNIRPVTLIVMTLLLGICPSLIVYVVFRSTFLAAPPALTALVPWAFIQFRRTKRSNRLREQLPDALELMSRMLRAGQTIPQSLRGIADEFSNPIADEFAYCYEQQNLGLPTDSAMRQLARRTGLLELKIMVVALTVHRQAGGNLSELLDKLAQVIRDRHRIQGQIRTLTADGRMQAAVLLGLPPFLMVVLSVINPEYITILYQFPWLITGMFAFEVLGALWLRRIVNFDF